MSPSDLLTSISAPAVTSQARMFTPLVTQSTVTTELMAAAVRNHSSFIFKTWLQITADLTAECVISSWFDMLTYVSSLLQVYTGVRKLWGGFYSFTVKRKGPFSKKDCTELKSCSVLSSRYHQRLWAHVVRLPPPGASSAFVQHHERDQPAAGQAAVHALRPAAPDLVRQRDRPLSTCWHLIDWWLIYWPHISLLSCKELWSHIPPHVTTLEVNNMFPTLNKWNVSEWF